MKKSKFSSILLSFLIAFSSFLPALPALAAPEKQAPAKIAPENLRLASPGEAVKAGAAKTQAARFLAAPAGGASAALPNSPIAERPAAAAPAALSTADEAASLPDSQSSPAAASRSTLSGLAKAFASHVLGLGFDHARAYAPAGAMGIRRFPDRPTNLPENIELDTAPKRPSPKERPTKAIPSEAGEPAPAPVPASGIFGADAIVLQADAGNDASIEQALRALIVQKTGIKDSELVAAPIKRISATGTIYANFYQQKNAKKADGTDYAIPVDGAELNFTVKIVKGKAVIPIPPAASTISPAINVDTTQKYSDAELLAAAQQRVGLPPNASHADIVYQGRTIIFMKDAWHAVNVYSRKSGEVMIAVDIANKEDAFAWDARLGVRKKKGPPQQPPVPDGTISAQVQGRAEADGERPKGVPQLIALAVPYLDVPLPNGGSQRTDKNGDVSWNSPDGKPVDVTLSLDGQYARVNDEAGNPLKIKATLVPGKRTQLLFNPEDLDAKALEKVLAQLNAYISYNTSLDFARANGLDDARLNDKITLNVNMNEHCNAYYDPSDHSLNFFLGNDDCVNTAKPDVVWHEAGHRIHFAIAGYAGFLIHVMSEINGGLSEGWGDIFAIALGKGNPIIGSGFFKKRTPNHIRDARNNYQYNEGDEVHVVGQAVMGAFYLLYNSIGAEAAAKIVFATMHANAPNIPAAIKEWWLADMDANGNIPHDAEIRAAAKAHGIDLPKKPGLPGIGDLVAWTIAPLSAISLDDFSSEVLPSEIPARAAEPAEAGAQTPQGVAVAPEGAGAHKTVKTKLVISAGPLKRGQAKKDIETAIKYVPGEYGDFKTPVVKETGGVLGSKFTIEIEGAEESVKYLAEQLRRLSGAQAVPHRGAPHTHGPSAGARLGIMGDPSGGSDQGVPIPAQKAYHQLTASMAGWQDILDKLRNGPADAQTFIMDKYYPGKTEEEAAAEIKAKITSLMSRILELESYYPGLGDQPQAAQEPSPGRGAMRDSELSQFLAEVSRLSSRAEINARIEGLYEANKTRLAWNQVTTLLEGLRDYTNSTTYDRTSVTDRIIRSWLSLPSQANEPIKDAELKRLFEVVGRLSLRAEINLRIEEYYNKQKGRLTWNQVTTLLGGLRDYTNSTTYDRTSVTDRITQNWLSTHH